MSDVVRDLEFIQHTALQWGDPSSRSRLGPDMVAIARSAEMAAEAVQRLRGYIEELEEQVLSVPFVDDDIIRQWREMNLQEGDL